MKWATEWWGICITAETNEERTLLETLFKALPDEPIYSYEAGSAELVEDERGELQLILER